MKYLTEFGETVVGILAAVAVIILAIANIILWGCV